MNFYFSGAFKIINFFLPINNKVCTMDCGFGFIFIYFQINFETSILLIQLKSSNFIPFYEKIRMCALILNFIFMSIFKDARQELNILF